MEAVVLKVTEKSILVGAKGSKYSTGYDAIGYCKNPDNLKKGDTIPNFKPSGLACKAKLDPDTKKPVLDDKGNPEIMRATDGSPLMWWIFDLGVKLEKES